MNQEVKTMDQAVKAMTEREGKYLTFSLDKEEYGISILKIKEIIGMMPITTVPQTPEFVKGVINLRGKVIPVVDLRKRFGVTVADQTQESRIVVVDISGEDIGVMVDAVNEVMRLAGDAISPASELITTEDSYYLQGIAKLGDKLLILLDLDKVLSKEERAALVQAKETATGAEAGVA